MTKSILQSINMGKNKIISLFSGAGGLDIGFHQAGFETAVLLEMDSSCCQTLRKNLPSIPVIEGDICSISTSQILETAKLEPLEAALVIGGPPCQSFSLAGKRMGLNDPRGRLVLEFVRVVRESLPKAFVMENVRGLCNWSNGEALKAIIEEVTLPIRFNGKEYQYQLSYKVLDAANFGAPQHRERIFIVGNRLEKEFIFPNETHCEANDDLFSVSMKKYVTVGDAILTLPPATPPSAMAMRVSQTIKGRIERHGY